MVYTIEQGFLTPAKNALTSLKSFLKKAQEHPNAASFPEKRIIDDMNPLTFQVHAATTQVFWALTPLTDGAIVGPDDGFPKHDGFSWDEIFAHIDRALKAIEEADIQYIVENCEKVRKVKMASYEMEIPGVKVSQIMQANIFFHVVTAYNILRKDGVELGKRDFLGAFLQ